MLETGRRPLRLTEAGFDAEALAFKLWESAFCALTLLFFLRALARLYKLRAQLRQFHIELGEARALAEGFGAKVAQAFALALQLFLRADVCAERGDLCPGCGGTLDQLFEPAQITARFD